MRIHTYVLLAFLGIGACSAEAPRDRPLQPTGKFSITIDPAKGTAVFGGTTSRAVYSELMFGEDMSTVTNPANTIQAVTESADLPGENMCPGNTNCFSVRLTNFTGAPQGDVFMGIDGIAPLTGRALIGATPAPLGVTAALGGRDFGDLVVLGNSVRDMDFTLPGDLAPYTVYGRFWGDDGFSPAVANCQDILNGGGVTNGVYSIDPQGAGAYDAYCEQTVAGGGWTLVANLNTADGHVSLFLDSFWTALTFGAIANPFLSDFKSAAATDIDTATQLMVIVRLANAPENGPILAFDVWNLLTPGTTFQSFFDGPIGDSTGNPFGGGCNVGFSGSGRQVTNGVALDGGCAQIDAARRDTFTCAAPEIYVNSYYGTCEFNTAGEAFRMSSFFRWPNNAQVGLGLQMDGEGTAFDLEAGNHLAPDTDGNPQRHSQAAAIGTDFFTPNVAQGQAWRYEWYVR